MTVLKAAPSVIKFKKKIHNGEYRKRKLQVDEVIKSSLNAQTFNCQVPRLQIQIQIYAKFKITELQAYKIRVTQMN